jgi:thioredoxin-like negative regulator of GroEL
MSSSSNLVNVTDAPHFQSLLSADLNRVSLINFWAPWAAPCTQMNAVVAELAKKHPGILALNVEAEGQAEIAESFDIEAVPSFVVLRVCLHVRMTRIQFFTIIFGRRAIPFLIESRARMHRH